MISYKKNDTYRKMREECLMSSMAMPVSYEEHTKEKVLEELNDYYIRVKAYTIQGRAEALKGEENDLLWILKMDEVVDKGIYKWKKRNCDKAIIATPVAMALIMEEFQLAKQLCELLDINLCEECIYELNQDETTSYIGGNSYTFIDAWMVSEIPNDYYFEYFSNKVAEAVSAKTQDIKLLEDTDFFEYETEDDYHTEDIRPIVMLVLMNVALGKKAYPMYGIVVSYIMNFNLDSKRSNLWEQIFGNIFFHKEDREEILQCVHKYFLDKCTVYNIPAKYEKRIIAAVKEYSRHEKEIKMERYVKEYVLARCDNNSYLVGSMSEYLYKYMMAVRSFAGIRDGQWLEAASMIFEKCGKDIVTLCIDNDFIKKEYLLEHK